MFFEIIIGGLIVIIILLYYKLIRNKLQLKNINKQLEKLNNKLSRETIKVSLGDSDIERLACNINNYINKSESICNETKRHEVMLKQQISDISHDLRTPLTSIIGYIQLLESEKLDEKQKKEYLRIIHNKASVLGNLINCFFELSIIDSEEYPINIKKLDITALIYNTILSNYTIMKNKHIEPEVDIYNNAININSDEIVCERIVQNLITNAVKYTEGTIYMKLTRNSKGEAEFLISNEIKNLEEKEVNALLNRFYTVDKARTKGNTGLGLYIVKVLINRINGKIEVIYDKEILTFKVVFCNYTGK